MFFFGGGIVRVTVSSKCFEKVLKGYTVFCVDKGYTASLSKTRKVSKYQTFAYALKSESSEKN